MTNKLQDTEVIKEITIQIVVKAVHPSAGFSDLVFTLLVFGTYPQMHAVKRPAFLPNIEALLSSDISLKKIIRSQTHP